MSKFSDLEEFQMMYDWIKLFSKFFDMDLTWKVVTSHQKHAKFKKKLI